MAYVYKKQHVDSSKWKTKCPYSLSAKYITIHNTANDASAKNEVAYHNRNTNQVSYHIAIDDVEAIECVPLNRNAWHCGDGGGANSGNRTSIGIEICYSKSGGSKYVKAEENAVQLTAKMLHERNWDIKRVKKHEDWSGKFCPHRILADKRWNSFLNRIQKALDELKKPSKPVQPNKPTEPERKIAMLKDTTSDTLKNEFIKSIQTAYNKGVIKDEKWLKQAQSGELRLADAILLMNYINK